MDLVERMKGDMPHMQKNLHELEMKHAWLLQEADKLKGIIENQRGAIMTIERLLAPEVGDVVEPTGSSQSVSE